MTTSKPIATIFFDLGATLVEPSFTPNGAFSGFTELPGARDALQKFSSSKLRLGVISNTGTVDPKAVRSALKDVKLLSFFAADLVLLSGELQMDKSTPAIFRLAIERAHAETAPATCMFVGDEPSERRTARRAGMRTSRAPDLALKAVGAKGQSHLPGMANLAACVADARDAGLDSSTGPAEPNDYNQLLGRLETARISLPPIYREGVADPFLAKLREIGASGFNKIMVRDPKRQSNAGLMFDIAQAVLQNGEGFEPVATDAFEEVVSDL